MSWGDVDGLSKKKWAVSESTTSSQLKMVHQSSLRDTGLDTLEVLSLSPLRMRVNDFPWLHFSLYLASLYLRGCASRKFTLLCLGFWVGSCSSLFSVTEAGDRTGFLDTFWSICHRYIYKISSISLPYRGFRCPLSFRRVLVGLNILKWTWDFKSH